VLKKTGLAILVGLVALAGCAKQEQETKPATTEQMTTEAPVEQATPPQSGIPMVTGDTITTPSGLKYIVMAAGEGPTPTAGDLIGAHYTGWLLDGTKFDSSRDRGQPLQFPIGQGRVIRGWDEGLMAMSVGGHRLLIIPPELSYGERGTPGGPIPPNATLIFDVELVSITPKATP
jgi:peptidylprolyl isomerase